MSFQSFCHFELVEKSSKISPFRFASVEMTKNKFRCKNMKIFTIFANHNKYYNHEFQTL